MDPYQKGAAKRTLEQEKGKPDPTAATGSVDRTESPTQPLLEPASRGEDREGEHLYNQLPYAPQAPQAGERCQRGQRQAGVTPDVIPQRGGASEPTALEKPDRRNPNQVKPGEKNKNKTNPRKHPRGPPSRHPRNTVSLQCFTRKGGQGGSQKGQGRVE